MKKNYALVTGASSGIGMEIAFSLAKRGFNLLLTARRQGILDEIADNIYSQFNVNVKTYSGDLANIESPTKIFEFCKKKHS